MDQKYDRKQMNKIIISTMQFQFRSIIFLFIVILFSKETIAQNKISLNECYALAEKNYPFIKQKQLIQKSNEYTISNISKGILPQAMLTGQATYQSDVTSFSVNIPGIKINPPSKDQYKIYADISQPITDIFLLQSQKDLANKNAEIQEQNVEVELYKLKDRINQLYFGILLSNEQIKLNSMMDEDLISGRSRIEAAIQNGVDYKSSLDKIKAEQINNKQRYIGLQAQRKAYIEMLGFFIAKNLDESILFEKPLTPISNNNINRPELSLFQKKNETYTLQEKLIRNRNIPKFNLFIQTGIGKPSPLNFVSNKFQPYYLGGLKVTWSIMNLYTQKNEKQLLRIDQQANEIQKELFLFNTEITIKQQDNEITRLQELIKTDSDLVALRNSVKNTSKVQLENGIITTNDYIKEVNAEDQSRQSKLLHEIQLLIAAYNIQNTLGN